MSNPKTVKISVIRIAVDRAVLRALQCCHVRAAVMQAVGKGVTERLVVDIIASQTINDLTFSFLQVAITKQEVGKCFFV